MRALMSKVLVMSVAYTPVAYETCRVRLAYSIHTWHFCHAGVDVRCWAFDPPGGSVSHGVSRAMQPFCMSVGVGACVGRCAVAVFFDTLCSLPDMQSRAFV